MVKAGKTELVAARIARVPWWRSALSSLGPGRHRRHEEALERLAGRNIPDAVREEDVRTWLATIEARFSQHPRKHTRS